MDSQQQFAENECSRLFSGMPLLKSPNFDASYADEITTQLKTVGDYIRWAISMFGRHQVFYGHGTDNAWDEALHLVLGSLDLPLDTRPELLASRLTNEEKLFVFDQVKRRVVERVPTPYLLGKAWFAGLKFSINQNVLIPRSPFAELIDQYYSPWWAEGIEPSSILDLCAGSGCIGIASAMVFPSAKVDLVELSDEAIAVAEYNIDQFELRDRVTCYRSNLFQALHGQQYDLIVSNPPYVDQKDLSAMPEEFQHEPGMALGAGHDGLDIVKRILQESVDFLSEDGILLVEVGNSQVALEKQFPEVPFTWLEFERGGHGVFMLTAQQLKDFSDILSA